MRVAHIAQNVLVARLVNHSAFTRTADGVGWNGVWLGRVKGAEGEAPFEDEDNC